MDHATIERLFNEIARRLGIADPPPLLRTDEPTIALYAPTIRTAAYNPDRLRDLVLAHPRAAYSILVGLLGHELGHDLAIVDFRGFRDGWPVEAREAAADWTSGVALRRMGAGDQDVRDYVAILATINVYDQEHGHNHMRERDVWGGYFLEPRR